MDYVTLIGIAVGLLILITSLVGIRQRRKILQIEKFKAGVRQAFITNPEEPYDAYMPTERQVANWMNLYQNLAGMANTSAMITNQTFAAGGDGFLASVGRIHAAAQSSRIRKQLLALHLLLNQCARVNVVAQQRNLINLERIEAAARENFARRSSREQGESSEVRIDRYSFEGWAKLPLQEREAADRRDRKRKRREALAPRPKFRVSASEALGDELIDAIGELAYLEAEAIATGAIPEFMKVLD